MTHQSGYFRDICVGLNGHALQFDFQDLLSRGLVGGPHIQDSVQSTRTDQGRILDPRNDQPSLMSDQEAHYGIGSVGRSENSDSNEFLDTIHLIQQTCEHTLMRRVCVTISWTPRCG